jgi:hypothetical protein
MSIEYRIQCTRDTPLAAEPDSEVEEIVQELLERGEATFQGIGFSLTKESGSTVIDAYGRANAWLEVDLALLERIAQLFGGIVYDEEGEIVFGEPPKREKRAAPFDDGWAIAIAKEVNEIVVFSPKEQRPLPKCS